MSGSLCCVRLVYEMFIPGFISVAENNPDRWVPLSQNIRSDFCYHGNVYTDRVGVDVWEKKRLEAIYEQAVRKVLPNKHVDGGGDAKVFSNAGFF